MSISDVIPYIEKNVLITDDKGKGYKGSFLSIESGVLSDSGDDEMEIYTDKGFFWGIPVGCVVSIEEV